MLQKKDRSILYQKVDITELECWGASGGNAGSAIGGKGAYTNGIIYLSKNEKIYTYIWRKLEKMVL